MTQTENQTTGASGSETYINKAEVARRLNKQVRTVDNWMARGIIPYVKAGRSVLFKWSDVESHIQAHFRVCRLNLPKP